jgi:hypothetical protein
MKKILKIKERENMKKGISVVVATMVFGYAGISSALMVQSSDNQTNVIKTHTEVYVAGTNNASYKETTKYSVTRNDKDKDKTKINYSKDLFATNGTTEVVSNFETNGDATVNTPNLKTANKVYFNTKVHGLNGGTMTGTEKVELLRCQPDNSKTTNAFCGGTNTTSYKGANADIAMGSSYNASNIYATTNTKVTSITSKDTIVTPVVHYSIATGTLFNKTEGSVSAGTVMNVNNGTSNTEFYAEHTKANGKVIFSKTMDYQSNVAGQTTIKSNIDKVP